MSTSYTPPARSGGSSSGPTFEPASSGSSSAGAGSDADIKPVRPRGHARDDIGLLVLRLGLAAIMLAHGYQKFILGGGFAGTQAMMTQMGVPFAGVAGILIIVLELAGGVAMVFGLLTVLVAVCYAATMAGAILYVHLPHGFFVANGGYELAGLVGVVCVTLVITGAGRLSLDRLLFGGRRRRRVREAKEAGVS